MTCRKRIALYGGSFDPVHSGHLAIARVLSELFEFDEFRFVPAHVAPHKRVSSVTPAVQRYAMLALATQNESNLRVSSLEIDTPGQPYTFETLARVTEELGVEYRLYFVMGADSWAEITTWREWEQVLSLSNHIVVTRPGFSVSADQFAPVIRERVVDLRGADNKAIAHAIDEQTGPKIYITDAVNIEVSATEIRRAIHDGQDEEWPELVPEPVANFIRKYGLYREV